jgi:hypothetical protein
VKRKEAQYQCLPPWNKVSAWAGQDFLLVVLVSTLENVSTTVFYTMLYCIRSIALLDDTEGGEGGLYVMFCKFKSIIW